MGGDKDIKSVEEAFEGKKWRMISILSYAIVMIGFGLPIWWQTTRVYRAPLPLDEMLEMHPLPVPPLHVHVYASNDAVADEIVSILGASVHVSSLYPKNYDSMISVREGELLFVERSELKGLIRLTRERIVYFGSDVSGYRLAMFLVRWPRVELKSALIESNVQSDSVLRPFSASPKYDVLVTVVHPEPQQFTIEWDLIGALNAYLKPYLSKLSGVANFTIKSQWLYFVGLGVNPRLIDNHWALAEQLLPHIITPLEKKLSSQVAKEPCINLVIYVTPCTLAPLHLYMKTGVRSAVDAFVSPRWGGVQIANPNCSTNQFTPNTEQVMSTLITQFNQLLDIPSFRVPSEVEDSESDDEIPKWKLDYMFRSRTLEYLDRARLTLQSLAQLLSEISNIVITDEVAESVRSAVVHVAEAEECLRTGSLTGAFNAARIAAVASESAFTDPTLLALLYFPDDQKYAVYIPLFLPIMIPVIMSMKQIIQYVQKNKS